MHPVRRRHRPRSLIWPSIVGEPGRILIFKAPHTRRPEYRQLGMHRGWSGAGIGGKTLRLAQDFSKSTSLGTSLATCTFQRKVCLEAGGHARTGHLRPQMATWGNSDGHAGQLSREDSSSTQAPSRRRKPGFSAHDFLGNLLRACAHAPMLTYVTRTEPSLWVVSGRHGDSATWSFCA